MEIVASFGGSTFSLVDMYGPCNRQIITQAEIISSFCCPPRRALLLHTTTGIRIVRVTTKAAVLLVLLSAVVFPINFISYL